MFLTVQFFYVGTKNTSFTRTENQYLKTNMYEVLPDLVLLLFDLFAK